MPDLAVQPEAAAERVVKGPEVGVWSRGSDSKFRDQVGPKEIWGGRVRGDYDATEERGNRATAGEGTAVKVREDESENLWKGRGESGQHF
jgi:hypothetical protein